MPPEPLLFLDGRVTLHAGDCLAVLDALPEASIDAIVTDPPYHLTSIVRRFGAEGAAPAKDYSGEKDGATGALPGGAGVSTAIMPTRTNGAPASVPETAVIE